MGCSCDVKPQHHVSKGLVQGSDRFAAGRVCVWLVRGGPNIKRSSITQLELTHVARAYIENTLTMSAVTKTKLQERLTQKKTR